jgi:hypothetical protein
MAASIVVWLWVWIPAAVGEFAERHPQPSQFGEDHFFWLSLLVERIVAVLLDTRRARAVASGI